MEQFNFNGNFNQNGNNNSIIGVINGSMGNPPESSDPWKEKTLEYVTNGNLRGALSEIISTRNDDHTKNQVIQLLGRISKVENEVVVGTLSKQEEIVEINKIQNAIVTLVSGL